MEERFFASIDDLRGQIIERIANTHEAIIFYINDRVRYEMFHDQDCCENVTIEDICGDLDDLCGSPILIARESTGESAQPEGWSPDEYTESYTWTFYELATNKGSVTIRWYGTSNGYYSESVSVYRIETVVEQDDDDLWSEKDPDGNYWS